MKFTPAEKRFFVFGYAIILTTGLALTASWVRADEIGRKMNKTSEQCEAKVAPSKSS